MIQYQEAELIEGDSFVTSLNHLLRYFPWALPFAAGSLKISNLFDRLHDPPPSTGQLTPGITYQFSPHNVSVKLFQDHQ